MASAKARRKVVFLFGTLPSYMSVYPQSALTSGELSDVLHWLLFVSCAGDASWDERCGCGWPSCCLL